MYPKDLNVVLVYVKSLLVSFTLTMAAAFLQIKIILGITDFKALYLLAPAVIALGFGILAARIIILFNELKWYSIRDQLTNTFNHGYYKQVLNDWCHENKTFSLILMDIDYFKKVNDLYGHQVGDKTLICISELVSETKRLYDVFARHGGEEFVILAPRTDLIEAEDLANRIRKVIREATMPSGDKLTCSFGVAEYRLDRDSPSVLFDRADKALYESKHNGRDRVTLEKEE
ncbi:MAG: GGDEF domain-containing protein [Gammaproteobacteria bacterium]|nr:GGDEF domain-containing protein [Gammaproteobacteria bacterium]